MDHDNLCPGCFTDKGNKNPCPSCGYEERVLEASLYLPPRTILAEKYIIGKVLGQGGFGITYLGWDLNLDMKLAIKEFFPQGMVSRLPGQSKVISLSGEEHDQYDYGLERFLKEAKTLAHFEHHPNIVTVRDFFKANNTAYMVMNYVEGLTLENYLFQNQDKIPFSKSLDIIMPLLDALKEVHRNGIMHRDISPDNILINKKGRVVLIDFGAARQELREQSKSLSVILKAGYAPEEQYRSRGKQGPWTDIYAVGATLYRAVTGQVPLEAMDRLAEDDLKPPSQLGIEIKADQERVLLKAMAVRTADRYQTVEEFQNELLASQVNSVKAVTKELKGCPYCRKLINSEELKCKYCQRYFGDEQAQTDNDSSETEGVAEEQMGTHEHIFKNVTNTWMWILAFAPWIGSFIEYMLAIIIYNFTGFVATSYLFFLTIILNIALCSFDQKMLLKAGIPVKPLGSVFLVPVYMFKRAAMLKQNSSYAIVWCIVFLSLFAIPYFFNYEDDSLPVQISTADQLNDAVRNELDGAFLLTADIDLGVAPYNAGEGWEPIGTEEKPFNGVLDGNGFTISNLTIDRPNDNYVGLFGHTSASALFTNIMLEGVNVNGNDFVGGLVGLNGADIKHSYVEGEVTGFGEAIGGIAGVSFAEISDSYTMGIVSGNDYVGGLVGVNWSEIKNSYVEGEVTGFGGAIGGLVGGNMAEVIKSYAKCTVSGNDLVGGLVGQNFAGSIEEHYYEGNISNCYAVGEVTGTGDIVGGLVGANWSKINDSYAIGTVNGFDGVGGLVGGNWSTINDSYAISIVNGNDLVGGLVGQNFAGTIEEHYYEGMISNCYWSIDIDHDVVFSGVGLIQGGIAEVTEKTTAEMQTIAFHQNTLGWDVAGKDGSCPSLGWEVGEVTNWYINTSD